MREYGWTLGILAGFIGLTCMGMAARGQNKQAAEAPAAVVNGVPIPLAEVETGLKQVGPVPIELPQERRRQLRRELLESLIDEELIRQFLLQNAPRIEPAQVDGRILELQEELGKQGKTLADYCRDTKQDEARVRARISNTMQWHAYASSRRTEADVKRFHEENRDWLDGVVVRVSHIELQVPAQASEAERLAARNKLLALRQEIVSGKLDFAEAARKHSQSSSAENGGDLGYVQRKLQVDEAFAKVAFALQRGDISDVVQTENGMHLIKIDERRPDPGRTSSTAPQLSDFNQVKEEVVEMYDLELRMSIIAQQRRSAKVEINMQ